MIRFANPHWLWMLTLVAPAVYVMIKRPAQAVRVASVSGLAVGRPSLRARGARWLPVARVVAFGLLVVALARPQAAGRLEIVATETVDIMFALDVSTSMAAEDFEPSNRLDVAKRTIAEFIARRASDRIGLLTFAGHTWLKCPLTLDYTVLGTLLESAQLASAEDDGTAIGMALASATNHLRASPARSRVIILLTDGENNRTTIEPATGAQLAAALGIRLYTIGVGSRGVARVLVDDPTSGRSYANEQVTINEEGLRQIAETTGGRYFRATDSRSLAEVLGEVDRLERTPLGAARSARYTELYPRYCFAGLGVLMAELALAQTWLRRLGGW